MRSSARPSSRGRSRRRSSSSASLRSWSPAGHGIGPIDPADPPKLHEEQLEHARALLRERGVEVESQAALGDPAEMILDVAEARDADLIVVGSREVGLIRRLLGQSVSGAVQRKAHCDVLIVH